MRSRPARASASILAIRSIAKSSAILDAIQAAVTEKNSPCSAISISFSFCGGSKGFYKTQSGSVCAGGRARPVGVRRDRRHGAAGLKLKRSKALASPAPRASINELGSVAERDRDWRHRVHAEFDSGGNDVGFVSESVWNDGDGATGGGESKVFKKPAFQKGVFKQDKKRDVPDISFGASPDSPGFFYGGRNGQRRTRRRMLHRRHQPRRSGMGGHQPADLAAERRSRRQSQHANLPAGRRSERRDNRNSRRNLGQH